MKTSGRKELCLETPQDAMREARMLPLGVPRLDKEPMEALRLLYISGWT